MAIGECKQCEEDRESVRSQRFLHYARGRRSLLNSQTVCSFDKYTSRNNARPETNQSTIFTAACGGSISENCVRKLPYCKIEMRSEWNSSSRALTKSLVFCFTFEIFSLMLVSISSQCECLYSGRLINGSFTQHEWLIQIILVASQTSSLNHIMAYS